MSLKKQVSILKKILFIISIACMILGCHKKETARLSNHLEGCLEKAQNNTLSVEQRISFNNKALKLILQSENKPNSLFFNQLFKVAGIYYNIKELETYKTTSERIVIYAQQVKDTSNLAKGYEYIGDYYKEQSLKDSAYCYYLKAEKQYTLVSDKENIGKMLFNKASVQYNDGDLARSEMFCLEALHYFNDVKGKSQGNIYDTYNLLGMLANDQKQYHKALEYHNKALQILVQDSSMTNSELLKSATLNNIGIAYQDQNKDKEALPYFTQALETDDLLQRLPALYAMLLDNTAYSHIKLKEYTGVQELFYKALRIRENLNLVPGIVINKLHMSEYYHEQKDIEKAFIFADEAYKTAKTKGTDPRDVMLSLKQLQAVDPSLKVVYITEYNHIADSLQQIQPKIHETITQELVQAEAKEETEMKKKEKLKTVIIELGVIVCFIGVHYIMHRKNKKSEETKIAKLQAELDANVQEKQVFIQEKQEKEAHIKVYDLMLRRKSKDSDTDNHYFVVLIKELLDKQRKYITINEYIDEGIAWDDLDHTVMIHLYHIIKDCFEVINQNHRVTIINFEIFQEEKTKDIIVFSIDCKVIIKTKKLQKILSNTRKIGGKIAINNQEGKNDKIEIILGTKLPQRIIEEQNKV